MNKKKLVKFTAKQSPAQIGWGGNDDPNKLLKVGKKYEVLRVEVHSWHTKVILKDFPDKKFNDVTFEWVPGKEGN